MRDFYLEEVETTQPKKIDYFSQEVENEPSYKGPSPLQAVFPGSAMIEPVKKVYESYNKAIREPVSKSIGKLLPEGGVETKISMPNPITPFTPGTNIPLGKTTGREALEDLGGMATDEVMTAGLLGIPRLVGRLAPRLVRGLADIPTKSIKQLREIGPKNVFKAEIESPEFVGKELVPKVSKTIQESLGIPDDEIARIKDTYKGSVSPLVEKIGSGLRLKIESQKSKIGDILSNPKVSSRINVSDFNDELTNQLSGFFKGGKLRKDLSKGDIGDMKELVDMYNSRKKIFDKTEFILRRNRLVDLQQSPNGLVAQKAGKLKDALDLSAERFDFGGLTEAKKAYKQASEMEKQFLNRSTERLKFAESKLGRVGAEKGLPIEEEAALKELEDYLGSPFIDEAKKINKIAEFESNYDPLKLEKLLKSAQNPENFQVREILKKLLGNVYPSIDESLKAGRIAQEFSPKGLYASRGGIIKGTARTGLKTYEEIIRPSLRKLVGKK